MSVKSFQTGRVVLVSFAHLMHDIYSSFLAPLLPLLIEKFSLSYTGAGALSLLQRVPVLVNPVVGITADRLPMRYFIIISPAITAITMSLLGAAPSITLVIVLLLVMGISSSLFHVPTPVMIRKLSGERVGRGMSFYMFGGEMARTLGPLVILGAVSLWGMEGTYRLIPLGIAASVLLYFRIHRIHISEDFKKKEGESALKKVFVRHMPLFVILIGITFFRAIMRASLTTFLPTYMDVIGEGWKIGGIYLSVLELAGAVGTLFWGTISDKIGRKGALIIIALVSPVMMYLFTVTTGWVSLVVLVGLGFFLLGTTPILLALVQDRSHERPAFMNSMFMTISFGTGALAVVLAGALADWIGMQMAFRTSAFIAVGAIPFVLAIRGKR
jgi:FSR family fosmidomycin resistance protein-like MFS transporter